MFGVAMYRPTREQNVGGMLRSAHVFGADVFCTIGAKYRRAHADTTNAAKHMRVLEYEEWQGFLGEWQGLLPLVAVENAAYARPLAAYPHPEDAMYILGSELQGLPAHVLAECDEVVRIDTPNPWPLNVTTAGSIVIAYRFASSVKTGNELVV